MDILTPILVLLAELEHRYNLGTKGKDLLKKGYEKGKEKGKEKLTTEAQEKIGEQSDLIETESEKEKKKLKQIEGIVKSVLDNKTHELVDEIIGSLDDDDVRDALKDAWEALKKDLTRSISDTARSLSETQLLQISAMLEDGMMNLIRKLDEITEMNKEEKAKVQSRLDSLLWDLTLVLQEGRHRGQKLDRIHHSLDGLEDTLALHRTLLQPGGKSLSEAGRSRHLSGAILRDSLLAVISFKEDGDFDSLFGWGIYEYLEATREVVDRPFPVLEPPLQDLANDLIDQAYFKIMLHGLPSDRKITFNVKQGFWVLGESNNNLLTAILTLRPLGAFANTIFEKVRQSSSPDEAIESIRTAGDDLFNRDYEVTEDDRVTWEVGKRLMLKDSLELLDQLSKNLEVTKGHSSETLEEVKTLKEELQFFLSSLDENLRNIYRELTDLASRGADKEIQKLILDMKQYLQKHPSTYIDYRGSKIDIRGDWVIGSKG